jgi:hypothetical protein
MQIRPYSSGRLVMMSFSPRPRDWRAYLESAPIASPDFMADVDDLFVQERDV